MNAPPDWLPAIIECDWNRYSETIERAYAAFLEDFGPQAVMPTFRGKRLGAKRHPELEGKSATFWHFVTEDAGASDRVPVRARIERIRWPRQMIVEAEAASPRVLVWSERRRHRGHSHSTRWVIALRDFSYVVILDERDEYVLPWTAYTVDYDHRRVKLEREYEAWRTAQNG